mmetsp:Transcript_3347/g.11547  ORF Transcript_3347/g.11547 Transcript_3347/m.11547 type:complete len:162 (+) Transcript_3347:281-766(+)
MINEQSHHAGISRSSSTAKRSQSRLALLAPSPYADIVVYSSTSNNIMLPLSYMHPSALPQSLLYTSLRLPPVLPRFPWCLYGQCPTPSRLHTSFMVDLPMPILAAATSRLSWKCSASRSRVISTGPSPAVSCREWITTTSGLVGRLRRRAAPAAVRDAPRP